jgi:hypothetical protein
MEYSRCNPFFCYGVLHCDISDVVLSLSTKANAYQLSCYNYTGQHPDVAPESRSISFKSLLSVGILKVSELKLFLCSIKHYAMKPYGEWRYSSTHY